MKPVEIYWPWSHDCGDSDIQSQLEAANDEGPLLVLSADPRSPHRPVGPIGIFRNTAWYLASLVDDEEPVLRERWVGLVRGADEANGNRALVALQRLARLLDVVQPQRSSRFPGKRDVPEPPYGAVTEQIEWEDLIDIENSGEAFADVAVRYPNLRQTMKI